jgi:uncharacterized protein (DUF2147 family)
MRRLCAAIAVFLSAACASANPATDPAGEWLVAKRVARIKIVRCAERLWGLISWEAEPGLDSNNPDPAKRKRPTLGMPILLGMKQTKPNEWSGEIYNAEDGRKYASSISLLNPDLLKVQGCVLGFLCGGENWTRVGAPPSSDDALCQKFSGAAKPSR